MKTIKSLATTALLSTSFLMPASPAFAVPSPAADPNAPTLAQMQAICDTNYVNTQEDPSVWRSSVVDPSSQATTPTAVTGTERNVNYRPDTGSTFSYAGFTNTTNPLTRTGGSPNMWGQMVFSQKVWDNTLYDVEMRFAHDVTYTWTCRVEENVHTVVHHPGNGGGGNGGQCTDNPNGNNNGGNLQTGGNGGGNSGCGNGNGGPNSTSSSNTSNGGGSGNNGNNNGGNLQNGGNGGGNNGCGNGNGGPNGTNENCGGNDGWDQDVWTWTFRADYGESQTNTGIDDGYDVTQTGLQMLGHAVPPLSESDYIVPGVYTPPGYRLLSCISPGKKGGAWTAKSWYTGGQCSTTTFNAAPTVLGNTFDNPPTNSLPAN